jgi:putative transposase
VRAFRRYHEEGYAYFITTNTEGRSRIFASHEMAQVAIDTLIFYRDRGDFILHAFVVMPDHMHLLMTPLVGTISDAMRNVKSWIAKEVRQRNGIHGKIWQTRFHDTFVRNDAHFNEVIQYIHWNPVMAGIVREPGDYHFSSWGWWEVEATVLSGLGP